MRIRSNLTAILKDILASLEKEENLSFPKDLQIEWEHPKDPDHGDYSTNLCLKLSRKWGENPRELGGKIIKKLNSIEDFSMYGSVKLYEKAELAGPGFINIYLSRSFLSAEMEYILKEKEKYANLDFGKKEKVLIEHTAVNPNKAIHVGHIRNSILGDSLARVMKKCGYQVKIENYLDDTGVQVADIVSAFLFLDKKWDQKQKFDHFCWDLYTEIQKKYEEDPSLKEKCVEVQRQMEEGKDLIAKRPWKS